MPKTLVVCYSLTGNTRRVGQALARESGAAYSEILDARPRRGAWGQFRSMAEAMLGLHPAIRYHGPDPDAYDRVLIGTPVWAGRPASPVRTWLRDHGAHCDRYGVFCTYASQGGEAAAAACSKILRRPPEHVLLFPEADIRGGAYLGRVRAFAHPDESPGSSEHETHALGHQG